MRYITCFGIIFILISCRSGTNLDGKLTSNNKSIVNKEDNGIALHFMGLSGSKYIYTITNETETELEANGKTVTNQHKSEVAITYTIQKDSGGNYVLQLHYDKIHLYSKTGDQELEMDASNAAASINPTEKMLGVLKEAKIAATISPAGKVVTISGYKELGEKILAGLGPDVNARTIAQNQWEKVIGDGMVKKSIERLFNILPDSAVQVGDTWKKNTKEAGEINMTVASTFKLKDMEDGIASIESEGEMTSDKDETQVMGYAVTSDLQGDQQGEYEVETKTGMVVKNNTISKLKGTLQMMGKEIPVTMKTTLKMSGRKI